jgi:Phospholipase_D-nuclease N-terminal
LLYRRGVLYFDGALGIALLALWLYCIFDVIATEDALVRNLPKIVWLFIVIFLPDVGSIAWLILGRPLRAGLAPGDTTYRKPASSGRFGSSAPEARPIAPDDDPRFLAEIDDRAKRLRAWEDDLRRREDELRRKEDGDDA